MENSTNNNSVENSVSTKNKTFSIEISRFIIVGIGAVACDSIVYFILIQFLSHSPAKTISFLSGTIVAYIFNKYWTFEKKNRDHKEMAFFFLLYVFTLLVNVAVNKISLNVLNGYEYSVTLAFLLSTGTSTVLNFIGQKWLVFE